jgi:hypothetical protein
MQFTDSVTRKFLQYSSPSWRNEYATTRPNKFKDYEDPTYIGFYVRFKDLNQLPYKDVTGDFDTWPGGLFYNEDHPDSAIKYLKNIGEYTRAQMLREFIEGIQNIQRMPWFITKVSGLEDIWKINPAESFRGKDKKLTFETLESIDLKMTYLIDLYRKACYDSVYMRWMLPENLRKFEMELVITEIRSMQRPADALPATNDPNITQDAANFQNPIQAPPIGNIDIPGLGERGIQSAVSAQVPNTQWASGLSNALISTLQRDPGNYSNYPILMKDFDELATFLVFEFAHCEFDMFEEAPTYFGALGKFPDKEATNKFVIKTPIIRERNTYGLLGAILKDTQGLLDRNQDRVESYFWDPADRGVPSREIGYISGIKNEVFNNSQQTVHQNQLREENTRLNGILGGLLGTVSTIATAQLSDAVQGAVAGVLLGNAFADSFPPEVAQAIAQQVQLEAPPFIESLLTNIALESNGATTEGPVSPAVQDLVAPPISEGGGTVVFIAPSTSPAAPETVPFESAPVGAPTATNVPFEGAAVSDSPAGSVELAAPPAGSASSTTVSLEEPLISPSPDKVVALEGPILGPPSSTSVILVEPQINGLTGTAVDLQGPAIIDSPPGQTDLQAPPSETGRVDSVDLQAPPVAPNQVTNVDLTSVPTTPITVKVVDLNAPPVAPNQVTNVDLTSVPTTPITVKVVDLNAPPVASASATNVSFEDGGASMDGTGGNVSLDGPKIQKNLAANEVDLEGAEPSKDMPANAELTGAPVPKSVVSKTELEAPAVSNVIPDPVNLTAPTLSNTRPTSVNLEAPPSPEIAREGNFGLTPDFGAVPLEGPSIPEKILGTEPLVGPETIDKYLNPVILLGAPVNSDNPELGKTELEGERILKQPLGKVIMSTPSKDLEITNYTEIGKVDQKAPQQNDVINEKSTGLNGPNINIETPGSLGNSSQEAPPTNTDK